jgi:hypothetical protein
MWAKFDFEQKSKQIFFFEEISKSEQNLVKFETKKKPTEPFKSGRKKIKPVDQEKRTGSFSVRNPYSPPI